MSKKETGVVNIRGKEYKTVALRVSEFREKHPLFSLTTTIVEAGDPVIVRAEIADESGRIIATGHAEELRSASQINKTSALENCETSAIGRALAAFGLAGSEFASADEVANAIHQQSAPSADPVAEYRARIGKKLMAAFGGDSQQIKEWLESKGFKPVRESSIAELKKIEEVLG